MWEVLRKAVMTICNVAYFIVFKFNEEKCGKLTIIKLDNNFKYIVQLVQMTIVFNNVFQQATPSANNREHNI